jgi:hypothetical protein
MIVKAMMLMVMVMVLEEGSTREGEREMKRTTHRVRRTLSSYSGQVKALL